jgi:O-antigen ligase
VNERPAARRWLAGALGVWVVGVLTFEPVAAAGVIATAVGVLAAPQLRAGIPSLGPGGWLRTFWLVAAFVGWALLAPTVAGRPPSATGALRVLDWVAVPFAAAAWGQLDASGRRAVLVAVGVTLFLSSAVAGLQHFGIWPPLESFESLRFTRIPFERVYEPVPSAERRFMGSGLAFHRLKFAHVGGLAALALLVAGLAARGRMRVLALAASFSAIFAIAVFAYARAASAAILASGVVAGALGWHRRRVAFAAGSALAVGALLLLAGITPVRQRFVSSVTATGSGDRHLLLAAGASVVRRHPWTGVGPGNFRAKDQVAADAPESLRTHPGKAHNQFLSMAAETGIPGALLFCGMLVALALRMKPSLPTGAFGLSALLFFGLLSLVHDPLFHAPLSMAIVLSAGVGLARAPETPR